MPKMNSSDMPSHTLCRKNVNRQLNYCQIMGICVLKRHLKSSSSEVNKNMRVWNWIYPKVGLKVVRKTISQKICLAKKLYAGREKYWKNAYKMSQDA